MKKIKQFRFFGVDSSKNEPANIDYNKLYTGEIFNDYTPIVKLGIQSLPGTTFYLNDKIKQNPIIIGYTGLYELDLEGIAEINALNFEISSLNNITNTEGACLIIDVIYDKEE